MASSPQVLPLDDCPRQKSYRNAVARCIRQIKAKANLSNIELAEEVGCSAETISNAENENNDLSGVTLMRIAYRFGEEAIAPVRELYLRRYAEPKTPSERWDEYEAHGRALRRELGL